MSRHILASQILLDTPSGKRLRFRPRNKLGNFIPDLAWSRLGVDTAELRKIAEDLEVFQVILWLLPPQLFTEESRCETEWIKKSFFKKQGLWSWATNTIGTTRCFVHNECRWNIWRNFLRCFITAVHKMVYVQRWHDNWLRYSHKLRLKDRHSWFCLDAYQVMSKFFPASRKYRIY